jgi:hypothetical protein
MSAGLAPVRHGRLPPCAGHDPAARPRLDHLIKTEDAALFDQSNRFRKTESRVEHIESVDFVIIGSQNQVA